MVLVKCLRQCFPCIHAQVPSDCSVTSKGRQGLIFCVQAANMVTVKLPSLLQEILRMLGQPMKHPTAPLCQKRLPGLRTALSRECRCSNERALALHCASFRLTPWPPGPLAASATGCGPAGWSPRSAPPGGVSPRPPLAPGAAPARPPLCEGRRPHLSGRSAGLLSLGITSALRQVTKWRI